MFTRRDAVVGLPLQCAASACHARGAISNTPKRMGILARGGERDEDNIEFERAVFASLLGKGWIEGRNLSVIRAYSGESEARLPALAEELVRRRVGVILTGGFITTVAAA